MIRENFRMSAEERELKKHKPWFNGGCSNCLDERKEAKLL
jgi:hypothetical protein